jgi:hypothetical protein
MARLLLLAYHFPPLGGPGTQRAVRFARDLPALGHELTVVTGPGQSTGRWDPLDETLMDRLTERIAVRRVGGPVPPGGGRADRWLDRRTPFAKWWVEGAVAAATPVARQADAILCTMAPYETAFAAAQLSQENGVPWIADLRDPWALDEMRIYPTALHRNRDLRRMADVLRTAHGIIMNTAEARTALIEAFPDLGLKHVAVVPNGFDSRDFLPTAPAPRDRDRPLRIVHTGSLHLQMGRDHRQAGRTRRLLGGAQEIDILPRSHFYLVEALTAMRRNGYIDRGDVELHLAGVLSDADLEICEHIDLVAHGYVDHDASTELLRSADLLFLPMHDLPDGRRARIVPGKTYEYLAAGRPILAAVPEGDARDLVGGAPGALLCAPTDARAMARMVVSELDHLRQRGRRPDRWHPQVSEFEHHHLADALSTVIERIVGRRGRPNPQQRKVAPLRLT